MRSVERPFQLRRDMSADDVRSGCATMPTERHPPYDWTEFGRRSRERSFSRRSPVKWNTQPQRPASPY
jgi:hypothetical protein